MLNGCKETRNAKYKNQFEEVKSVGQEGNFLKQKSTRGLFRSDEYYKTSIIDNYSYEEWLSLGSPNMMNKARARVNKILEAEMKNPLDKNIEKTIREIMEEARAKL